VADGTILEMRGIQTAAIVTDTFQRTGDAMARRQGYPGYRYVTMVHPISSLSAAQIKERARDALPQVLGVLGVDDTDKGKK